MYDYGSKISYKTIYDIKDNLNISFIINNLIFTCGHCLPENVIFDDNNLELLYTSGFDNNNENIELGIIKIKSKKFIENKFNIKLTKNIICLKINNPLKLINNNIVYSANFICELNSKFFNLLNNFKWNSINLEDNSTLWFNHQITKICSDKLLFDKIDLSNIILYKSDEKNKSIPNDLYKIIEHHGFKINNNLLFNYLTEPSFSGSPIIFNNYCIGYHIGSVDGLIIKENTVIWIGKICYCKKLIFRS